MSSTSARNAPRRGHRTRPRRRERQHPMWLVGIRPREEGMQHLRLPIDGEVIALQDGDKELLGAAAEGYVRRRLGERPREHLRAVRSAAPAAAAAAAALRA